MERWLVDDLMYRDGGTRASMMDLPFVTMALRSRYRTCGVIVIHRRIRLGNSSEIEVVHVRSKENQ